jgi:hypothetical protein
MNEIYELDEALAQRLAELFTRRQYVQSPQYVEDQVRLVETEIQAILGTVRVMAGVPADRQFKWDGAKGWFEAPVPSQPGGIGQDDGINHKPNLQQEFMP